MKLFIWNDPYGVNYGGSILFVMAEDEASARELAKTCPTIKYGFGKPDGFFCTKPLGAPDRVIEQPGGECYEWSE